MNTLPQELIDHTIDFLHDDKPALSACCSANKAFLPACSFHLFSTLCIPLPYSNNNYKHGPFAELEPLFQLLQNSDRIRRNVKELRVECRDFVAPARPFDVLAFRRMVRPLERLKTIYLHGVSLYHCDIDFESLLSPPLASLLRLDIEGSRLRWDSLSLLLHSFAHIEEVNFTRVLSVTTHYSFARCPLVPMRISTLSFAACPRVQLSALLPPLMAAMGAAPHTVRFYGLLLDDMHAVNDHLDAYGAYIERLQLDLPDRWFSWDPPETSTGTCHSPPPCSPTADLCACSQKNSRYTFHCHPCAG